METLEFFPDHRSTSKTETPGFYTSHGKRIFDVVFAVLLLPLLVPVIAALWLLTRRDGGSGFFGHMRIGQNGQPFKCWKVRTMVVGAEGKLKAYLADNREAAAEWARDQKLSNDPRITRFGDFLRKTSLDELPQIWNVLKGEMSFVGPRPVVRDELVRYGPQVGAYLAMRPGITGLWQVSGRNNTSYQERIELDCQYKHEIGFSRDLWVIAKTVKSVALRTGQ
ncbi:MAG: exopolysaccharide biosynthesis protein [Alphaproteobacteria bacterium]|nr:MAG: exopolysaccharide biosynthesis protein [Alphaproteobacteria bacterium]